MSKLSGRSRECADFWTVQRAARLARSRDSQAAFRLRGVRCEAGTFELIIDSWQHITRSVYKVFSGFCCRRSVQGGHVVKQQTAPPKAWQPSLSRPECTCLVPCCLLDLHAGQSPEHDKIMNHQEYQNVGCTCCARVLASCPEKHTCILGSSCPHAHELHNLHAVEKLLLHTPCLSMHAAGCVPP